MDEVGTVVLEVKDIDWEASHTIPTFDDVKVEEMTPDNYISDHDIGNACENIVEGKDVIESVIVGSADESVREIIFSPSIKDSLKTNPLDIQEIIKFDSDNGKDLIMLNASDIKPPPKAEGKVRKKYSVPQKFNCDLCNLKFVSHCSLQIHLRRHLGYKPFSCQLCDSAYPTKTQLVRHMKNHTNKLEHFCGECGKSCLDIGTVKKHAKFKHGATEDTYNLYRIKEELTEEGEKVIFIKTYRNGETNIRRFRSVRSRASHYPVTERPTHKQKGEVTEDQSGLLS
ncbi:zinc finger protein 2-like isoform X1 [Palaemon carinicauda]|uniref:zinc finger protein 2-like isoform X1 n=1 Tax=Palaemon carinicauda TaxID=392227 RepID=UPI0035B59D1E